MTNEYEKDELARKKMFLFHGINLITVCVTLMVLMTITFPRIYEGKMVEFSIDREHQFRTNGPVTISTESPFNHALINSKTKEMIESTSMQGKEFAIQTDLPEGIWYTNIRSGKVNVAITMQQNNKVEIYLSPVQRILRMALVAITSLITWIIANCAAIFLIYYKEIFGKAIIKDFSQEKKCSL